MKTWFRNSWFSCRRYAERVSQASDGKLPFWDALGFWFHHGLCFSCRIYRRQIKIVNAALGNIPSPGCADPSAERLDPDAKQRILSKLRKAPD